MSPLATQSWSYSDSGVRSGQDHMDIDRRALNDMLSGSRQEPSVRFFQWMKPVITYGYLLHIDSVKKWADENGGVEAVQRPTAGGAVLHRTSDLALSILWPRRRGLLAENPRECYRLIHSLLKKGVEAYLGREELVLFAKSAGDCGASGVLDSTSSETATKAKGSLLNVIHTTLASTKNKEAGPPHFSICFNEPVCNDVMSGGTKIIGGALRVASKAILYQGNIQLAKRPDMNQLKRHILRAFEDSQTIAVLKEEER